MASILKVDNMQGITSAKTVTVTVGTSATMNLLIGVVKMYAQSNNITPAVADSLNNASLTDNGSGKFTYNFTTNMSNATYGYGECSGEESGATGDSSTRTVSHSHRTSSTFRTSNRNSSNSLTDAGAACISTYGELA